MTTLFALTDQYRQLQQLADSETDIDEQTLVDTMLGLTGELQAKATNVGKFICSQDAMATAIEDAAKAMRDRAARLRRRNDWLKQYLLTNMQAAELTRIESPELVLSIKKNPPALVVFDEASVPVEFMEQKPAPPPTPNKARIKAILATGDDVPGCRLDQGVRLDVKI